MYRNHQQEGIDYFNNITREVNKTINALEKTRPTAEIVLQTTLSQVNRIIRQSHPYKTPFTIKYKLINQRILDLDPTQ